MAYLTSAAFRRSPRPLPVLFEVSGETHQPRAKACANPGPVLMEKRQALHDLAAKTAVYPALSPAQQLARAQLFETAAQPPSVPWPAGREDGIQERPRRPQLPDAPPALQPRGDDYGSRGVEAPKRLADEPKAEDASPELY